MTDNNTKTYTGGCHCGTVRYEAQSELITSVMECNCSHCSKKGLLLTFIPKDQFTLTDGEDALTEYRFNNHIIQHLFCTVCGTQAFAYGKDGESNEVACLNVRCVDDIDISALERTAFNGKEI
jgi:hypothetical protein